MSKKVYRLPVKVAKSISNQLGIGFKHDKPFIAKKDQMLKSMFQDRKGKLLDVELCEKQQYDWESKRKVDIEEKISLFHSGHFRDLDFPKENHFNFLLGSSDIDCFKIDGVDYYSTEDLVHIFGIYMVDDLNCLLPEHILRKHSRVLDGRECFYELISEHNLPYLLVHIGLADGLQVLAMYIEIGRSNSDNYREALEIAHLLALRSLMCPHWLFYFMKEALKEEDLACSIDGMKKICRSILK